MKTKIPTAFLLIAIVLVAATLVVSCKSQPTQTATKPPDPTAEDKKTETINGFLIPNSADGYNWPAGAEVTIRVYSAPGGSLLATTKAVIEPGGHFVQPVGMTMSPGMAVEVTDGKTTHSTTLVAMAIDKIDVDGDTVSGTSPGGAKIFVILGNMEDNTQTYLWVTADGGGHWQASFAGKFDITPTTVVQVTVPDANGNGTVVKVNQSELTR
jgi:hypothetical protein